MCYSTEGHEAPGEDFGAEAAAEALSRYTDEELEASVIADARWVDARRAQLALKAAELERRKSTQARHVLTTKQWLAHELRISKRAASTLLRTGHMLEEHQSVARRATTGEITGDGVRILTATARAHPEAFVTHGAPLVDGATYLNPRDLRRAVDYWRQQVDFPGAVGDVDRKRKRRRLSISHTWDGMYAISGELDPESGHIVKRTIDALADPGALDLDDTRTRVQRSADALVDVCRFSLDHDSSIATSGGEKPHVTVEVPWNLLTRRVGEDVSNARSTADADVPTVEDGGPQLPEIEGLPVDADAVRRLACDSGVVRLITGPRGEVLDMGRRTRTVPPAIRRALDRRDGGCTWSGCDAPVGWTDAHHIVHWADGGPTNMDNLRLLCRRHHTAVHDRSVEAGPSP